jgi:serine/threonine-protein kinase HipA
MCVPLSSAARRARKPAVNSVAYKPGDELYLWWLARPEAPRYVGALHIARTLRGVSLHYGAEWLASGVALSEDLPLIDEEFLPRERDSAAGAVDDARPDRWGERVIRFIDKPPRLSLLEYLYFAGDERFGALGVSTSATAYQPRRLGPLPTLADTAAIHDLVRRVIDNEPIAADQLRLLAPGVTMGGARPKALIDVDGLPWVVKFADIGEPTDAPLVEHATMTLARLARITTAETRAIRLADGHALAVRRFDRVRGRGGAMHRLHAQSAHVALGAVGEPSGYPELAQLLRRRGVVGGGVNSAQMHELFRRMVFNILIDNTDDHDKNHVLLMRDEKSGQLELAPAFDVLPSGQALGYQQMRVGDDDADATIANALTMCSQFGLKRDAAVQQARDVAKVVRRWTTHFANEGVSARDLEHHAAQIDRPFLREQRNDLVKGDRA